MSLSALRQELARVVPALPPSSGGVVTGHGALDLALGGELPRGRVTEISGLPGSGRTTLLRRLVAAAVNADLTVGYVDADRTMTPQDWADLALPEPDRGLWVVRPPDPARGAWCADVLLRSGAFPMVVLDGGPPLARASAVRLAALARERDAALVLSADHLPAGALPGSHGVHVAVRGMPPRRLEVESAVALARRLCAHSPIPDRRGVE